MWSLFGVLFSVEGDWIPCSDICILDLVSFLACCGWSRNVFFWLIRSFGQWVSLLLFKYHRHWIFSSLLKLFHPTIFITHNLSLIEVLAPIYPDHIVPQNHSVPISSMMMNQSINQSTLYWPDAASSQLFRKGRRRMSLINLVNSNDIAILDFVGYHISTPARRENRPGQALSCHPGHSLLRLLSQVEVDKEKHPRPDYRVSEAILQWFRGVQRRYIAISPTGNFNALHNRQLCSNWFALLAWIQKTHVVGERSRTRNAYWIANWDFLSRYRKSGSRVTTYNLRLFLEA